MADVEELDRLSSKELHDRAIHVALRKLDIGFFWDLLKAIPAAEAVAGHPDRAGEDIAHVSKQVADAFHGDEGELADALRPLYMEYLLESGP